MLAYCQGQRCTQTRLSMLQKKCFIALPSHSSQFLTEHSYFHGTQNLVAYYWRHHVTIIKLSALQKQTLKTEECMTSWGKWLDCEITDMKAQGSHVSFALVLQRFLLNVKGCFKGHCSAVIWAHIHPELTRAVNHLQHMGSSVQDLSESSLIYFPSPFFRPGGSRFSDWQECFVSMPCWVACMEA